MQNLPLFTGHPVTIDLGIKTVIGNPPVPFPVLLPFLGVNLFFFPDFGGFLF
jgi:hypothetical protein